MGRPEEVAAVEGSHTGRWLRPLLSPAVARVEPAPARRGIVASLEDSRMADDLTRREFVKLGVTGAAALAVVTAASSCPATNAAPASFTKDCSKEKPKKRKR